MREHFKGVIWPRGREDAIVKNNKKRTKQKVYRYVIVGMLVTDAPIEEFEGKNELLLDGPLNHGMSEGLAMVKTRKPKYKLGDASSVLCSLGDI